MATPLDQVLWWSGLVAWIAFGLVGAVWTLDQIINWAVPTFWTKREFFAFVADRLKHNREQ